MSFARFATITHTRQSGIQQQRRMHTQELRRRLRQPSQTKPMAIEINPSTVWERTTAQRLG
jgi:hypothetical protein